MSVVDEFLVSQRFVVAVATYNEIENLPTLVAELEQAVPRAALLIVDDNSPDGTGQWCERQRESGRKLHCLHRPSKLGLGSAAAESFRWAIDHGFEWIGTMDADLAHDPVILRSMIRAATEKTQPAVVIGSRYVAGGRIEGWPWYRRWASRLVNGVARTWLKLPARDNSSAFRLYRVAALREVGATELSSRGYGYLEEILWRLHRAGLGIVEVPITFRQRQQGRSKLGLRQVLAAARDLVWLPLRR